MLERAMGRELLPDLLQRREYFGPPFEGLVAQHLRAWIAYTGADDALFYWRARSGVEVDYVAYGTSGFWAIEVKNTAVVRSGVRALRAFSADCPECEPLLLYRGADRLEVGGIRIKTNCGS